MGEQGGSEATPPFEKEELKRALPLIATPSPSSQGAASNPTGSQPSSTPQKRFQVPDLDEVDDLRMGFVPPVNPMATLAEMKSAAAAPPPAPVPLPPLVPAPPPASSVIRGTSAYFTPNSATPASRKQPLIINSKQEGNIYFMKHIRIPYVYADIGPDFIFTPSACGFYLSMKFHLFNKPYIAGRVKEVRNFALRVVVCHVDTEDPGVHIRELSQHCYNLNVTLILAWSHKEAARYVETFKTYEGRPATMLQERVEESEKLADVLTVVRFVNKTDVQTLAHTFGTLKRIVNASTEELSLCPGLGARKVQKLHAAFTDPLDPVVGRKRKQQGTDISGFLARPAAAEPDPSSDL